MIFGIGNDIIQCERMEQLRLKFGEDLLKRILTPAEQMLAETRKNQTEFLAGRWAAKEALAKALGCGLGESCSLQDVEILPDSMKRPVMTLHGKALETANRAGISKIHLSISHERDYAVAMVVLETAD